MSIENELGRIADALYLIAGSFDAASAVINRVETGAGTKEEAAGAETKAADVEAKAADVEAKEKTVEEKASKTEPPSLDDVVAALQKYIKANGRDAAVELLGKFGAKRASDIDEGKRADFVREAG
jgi:hypothetical protein